MLRFKSSGLFGAHTLLDKSLRLLQLLTCRSKLSANELWHDPWVCSLGCKLIRVGWILHFRLLKASHFVWLEALSMLVNNPINSFFNKLKH